MDCLERRLPWPGPVVRRDNAVAGEPPREATSVQVMTAVAGLTAGEARWWSRPGPRDPGESLGREAGDLLPFDAGATGDGVFHLEDGPGTSTTSLVLYALGAGRV